jgi:hypothetical protein
MHEQNLENAFTAAIEQDAGAGSCHPRKRTVSPLIAPARRSRGCQNEGGATPSGAARFGSPAMPVDRRDDRRNRT